MGFIFEFNPAKAASNLEKHGASFAEARTVFDDPLGQTSQMNFIRKTRIAASRLDIIGPTPVVRLASRTTAYGSSVPAQPTTPNEKPTKSSNAAPDIDSTEADPLLPRKLDLSKAVRGKYYQRMQEGTNVVLLAPDLMDTFPNSEAVNDALRKYQALTVKQA